MQSTDVVGMLVAFPMWVDENYRNPDPVLAPYAMLEVERSFYICGMAVEAGSTDEALTTRGH